MAGSTEADGPLDMPQPVANPDAQTTVNDFLDYTEFFPSDLQRSLSLIAKLDTTYNDATQRVHDLTAQYGQLPSIPAKERSDPVLLRKQIGEALQRAINCREATFTEASRLYEVAERHCQRISVIKRKLQALPQPPSRDPTPAPVSPQASRSLNRGYERTPHLRLTFDGGRHGASSAARPRDRSRKTTIAIPRHRPRAYSMSSSDGSDDSDARSTIDLVAAKKLKQEKTPRPPKSSRARPPGVMGTNVHSSVAGISTSNALAKLSPPPPDAKPGSKWAPWFKLTEYEMAVLRKQMKKNAVWTPSPAMVKRELERKSRGQEAFDIEKARCEATGEEMIDEEPESLAKMMAARAQQAEQAATVTVSAPITEPVPPVAEPPQEGEKEDVVMANDDTQVQEPVKAVRMVTRESQRQQAMRDAQDLEDATKKIKQAAEGLKELSFGSNAVSSPTLPRRRSITKPTNKRKRETSPYTAHSPVNDDREADFAPHDSAAKPPESKRPRLPQLHPTDPASSSLSPLATIPGANSASPTSTFAARSPVSHTPVPLPEPAKATTTTVLVPLAPAGPGTPKTATSVFSEPPSPHSVASPLEPKGSSGITGLVQPQTVATAASSRPRRESAAPSKPSTPPPATASSVKSQKASTPGLEQAFPSPAPPSRPRSARGHVPTPKAQSEEPKPHEAGKPARELRRHSIFSQSTISGATRTSTRKKPPPKGDVSAVDNDKKSVTNVKRSQGNKNKKKKKSGEEQEANEEKIDPNEPRYCICDDVSYGPMISCDNNCFREWFHLECVNLTEEKLPSRRMKWFCPECRDALGTDASGNPLVPPPLPGRRGNR